MNAFEIRTQLLAKAQEFVTAQYEAQMKAWELAKELNEKLEEVAPKFPTITDVIAKATEMNAFVSGTFGEK